MPDTLAAALAWAARGFRIFPLRPNGTRPMQEGWTEWASSDPQVIRGWWQGHAYNIGVLTTDMLVVDIDVKDGRPGVQSWLDLHGGFDTLTVRTKSGGYHLYYSGANVGQSSKELGPGLDVRSHHGYVVGPGSVVDGIAYDVLIDQPMRQAPAHIVARCRPPGVRAENADAPLIELDTSNAIRLAVQRIERTQGAIRGEQSDQAYKLACALRDYGISEAMCGALMGVWAARCTPPIEHDDLTYRIANAYAYGQNAPGVQHPDVVFGNVQQIEAPVYVNGRDGTPAVEMAAWGNALPLSALGRRPYILRGFLLRGKVTSLLATGGVGKSLLTIVVAAHLAMGTDFLGFRNEDGLPAKSVIYDGEDSLEEMSMRLHAVCTTLQFDFEHVASMIRFISGDTHGRIKLVNGGVVPEMDDEMCQVVTEMAADPGVAMLGLNPLNTLHTVNPNDNVAMTFVMDVMNKIAKEANVGVLLAHHATKSTSGQKRAGNAEIAQGAAAVVNGSRHAFTLAPPEDEDAARFALTPADRRRLVRLDDAKANYTLQADEAMWLHKNTVHLYSGEDVGAFIKADMHARSEYMRRSIAEALKSGMLHTRGQGGVKLLDAVAILKAADPIFEKMPVALAKQRIEAYLAEAVVLPDGSRIVCMEIKGAKMVVLE